MPHRAEAPEGRRWRDLGVLVGAVLASRLLYLAVGVHFDVSPLSFFLQYADPALLKSDLPRTLVHFHVDPPLMNAVIGVALQAFGNQYGTALHVVFLAAGVAFSLALYTLMRQLGVGSRTSLIVSLAFAISPATVMFENLLYGDYLVAAALVVAAVALHRFASSGKGIPGIVAFSLLAGIVFSRSLFHLAWLLLIAAVVAWLLPRRRKHVLAVSLLPILACVALYGKNLLMFDSFGAATCLGLNLSRVTTAQLPAADRSELIRSGHISVLADEDFYRLPSNRPDLFAAVPRSGIPVRDDLVKSTGSFNYNVDAYLPICWQYQADAVYVAVHRPSAVFHSVRESLLIFFLPGSDYFVGLGKPSPMTPVARVFDAIAYGQVQMP
ncbi:MAG: hypothetical protein M3O87_07175, partial [Candidatus Dormibacteraeota bacterium]|nr:hypothetical protein [Candidatus Dormibacteraeota bacterium]